MPQNKSKEQYQDCYSVFSNVDEHPELQRFARVHLNILEDAAPTVTLKSRIGSAGSIKEVTVSMTRFADLLDDLIQYVAAVN